MKTHLLTVLSLLFVFTVSAQATKSFEVTVTGSGSPIIFVPGLACDSSVWDDAVARYSISHECHVLTLAGFGDSELPPISDSPFLEVVERELISYIKQQNLDRPLIIGHSLGGFVALRTAAHEPQLFSQLLVVDSLPFLPGATNPNATVESTKAMASSQREAMKSAPQDPERARQMLRMMITDPNDIDRAIEMTMKSHPQSVADAMYELNTTDIRSDVSKIQTPTLVLGAWIAYQQFGATKEGTASIFNSQYASHPNYELVMSDKGRHFIMWDDPEFFYEQLDALLAKDSTL